MTEPEQIGLLLVHGSGEQRRFEHLDSQVPSLVSACAPAKTRGDSGNHGRDESLPARPLRTFARIEKTGNSST